MRIAGLFATFAVALWLMLGTLSGSRADEAADRSVLIDWIERTISTPDRKISLGRIDGVLSSDVRIASITIADRRGVWLTIGDVHLVWSRTQLLRKILSIDLLEAKTITMTRSPDPAATVQPGATSLFTLPELPVAIRLGRLSVPTVRLSAEVAGRETALWVTAAGRYDADAVAVDIAATRVEPAGGSFALQATYDGGTRRLGLDLSFAEPKGGLVSTLMALPGTPAIDFSIKGDGPIDAYAADIVLATDGDRLLSGRTTIARGPEGLIFAADLAGTLDRLTSPDRADLLRGGTRLSLAASQTADGGLALDRAAFQTGILTLDASGAFAADGFPTALKLDGHLARGDGGPTPLPGTAATVTAATLSATFGDGDWRAALTAEHPTAAAASARAVTLRLSGRATALGDAAARAVTFAATGAVDAPTTADSGIARALGDRVDLAASARAVTLRLSGRATSLGDAAARAVTFAATGAVDAPTTADPGIARALGDRVDLAASGRWASGRALTLDDFRLTSPAGRAAFVGTVEAAALTGAWTLAVPDLARWSALAGRPLAGRADLTATGRLAPVTGAFGLTVDATLADLATGDAPIAALMKGATKLGGRFTRDTAGLHFDAVTLANSRIRASLDGLWGVWSSALAAEVALTDAAVLSDRIAGPLRLVARLDGPHPGETLSIEATAPALRLQSERLSDAVARLTATLSADGLTGDVTATGAYAGGRLDGRAHIVAAGGETALTGLHLAVAGATIDGDLVRSPAGRIRGSLTADIPDLARVAPLLLGRGRGAASVRARFDDGEGRQGATLDARLRGVAVETVTIAAADIALVGHDLMGLPRLEGDASLTALTAAGVTLDDARATFRRSGGDATALTLDGKSGGRPFTLAGRLAPIEGGFDLAVERLNAQPRGIALALTAPVTVSKRPGGALVVPPTTLAIADGGRLTLAGEAGPTLAFTVTASRLPAALADAFVADLGAGGLLSGEAKIGGTPEAPTLDLRLAGENLTARAARDAGLPPLRLAARVGATPERATIDATVEGGADLRLTAKGAVPLSGDGLAVTIDGGASLALADTLLRPRGGRASGRVALALRVGGSLAAPRLGGTASVSAGSLSDPETGMRLTAMTGTVRFDGDRVTIERFSAGTGKDGGLQVRGGIGLGGDHVADLTIALTKAQIAAGDLLRATIGGTVTLRGPLLTRPTIAGRIAIDRAEITVPERFAANAAVLKVKDLAPPPEVRRTLARVRSGDKGRRARSGPGFTAVLDLVIDAPARLFVRGRGIDAEFGGTLRLTGTTTALVPIGAIQLRRGALDVVGRHIAFDSGTVTLTGDLDPTIDLKASASSQTIAVVARVTGRASDPQLVLTSTPDLPQDEILAQFLFGHGISDLSGLQLVQLGVAAAQLAGGPSAPAFLDRLRRSTGLDSLGVVTDASGNAALRAGRYVGERIYLGVTAGAGGQTDATVNIDVSKTLKLRAQTGTEGSKGGVYFEKEY